MAGSVLSGGPVGAIEFYRQPSDYVCMAVSVLIAVAHPVLGIKYKNVWACVLADRPARRIARVRVCVRSWHPCDRGAVPWTHCRCSWRYHCGHRKWHLRVRARLHGGFSGARARRPKDRRPTFFALMFAFLSAMFFIVFSNNSCGCSPAGKSRPCARSSSSATLAPTRLLRMPSARSS